MKKVISLGVLILLLTLPNALSVTISSADAVSAANTWSFGIETAPQDVFEYGVVFLDSQKIGIWFFPDAVFSKEVKQRTLFVSEPVIAGSKLVVSLTGLAVGEHEIRFETFTASDKPVATQAKKIMALMPVSSEFQNQMGQELEVLRNQSTQLSQTVSELQQTNAGLNNRLEQQNELLSESTQKIGDLTNSVQTLQQNMAADKTVIQNLQGQVESMQAAQKTSKETGLTGFAGLGNAALLGIGVVIVIAIGFFVYQRNKKNAWENP